VRYQAALRPEFSNYTEHLIFITTHSLQNE